MGTLIKEHHLKLKSRPTFTEDVELLEHGVAITQLTDRAHAVVTTNRGREVERVAKDMMAGQAMLVRWGAVLANGDPFVADELHMFVGVARMAKAELLADLTYKYRGGLR